MAPIRCRAEIVESCYGLRGISEETVYSEGDQSEDRTWSRDTQTVVCDPCYMALGQPLFNSIRQLNRVVNAARAAQGKEEVIGDY